MVVGYPTPVGLDFVAAAVVVVVVVVVMMWTTDCGGRACHLLSRNYGCCVWPLKKCTTPALLQRAPLKNARISTGLQAIDAQEVQQALASHA